jgi:hypothetical protein
MTLLGKVQRLWRVEIFEQGIQPKLFPALAIGLF